MNNRKFKPNRARTVPFYFSSTIKSEPNRPVRHSANVSVIIKSPAGIIAPKERKAGSGRVHLSFHHRRPGTRAARSQGAADTGSDRCAEYAPDFAGLGAALRRALLDRRVRSCRL